MLRLMKSLASVAVVAVAIVAPSVMTVAAQQQYTPAALADQVFNLPGLATTPTFNMFAGYLNVNATSNRNLFYWYVESQAAPASDPVLWWSNGGPGCSGLLGFLMEHGPFRLQTEGGGLQDFPFAWNTLANVLYVEAPAGVGFSYSDNSNDYTTGDAQTAQDNFVAIEQFFLRFPHLVPNEFYISAESYGGHYVPQLATLIVANNQDANREYPTLNFKGFLLGNPLTDMEENQLWGQTGTLCGHSLAPRPTCDLYQSNCLAASGPGLLCDLYVSSVQTESGALDPYGLDFPVCDGNTDRNEENKVLLRHVYSEKKHAPTFSAKFKKQLEAGTVPVVYNPCGMSEATVYLNRADVRAAIHASPSVESWVSCSTQINYSSADGNNPQEPVYTALIAADPDLRLVIFSGDDDSVCATLGTQHWMYNLFGSTVTESWASWQFESSEYGSQIGGFITKFEAISLVTVHGAGHQVSMYQPERGLAVLKNFLAGAFSNGSPATKKVSATKKAPAHAAKKVLTEQ